MLTQTEIPARRRSKGMFASVVLHLAFVAFLLHRPEPVFVVPQSVQLGDSPKSSHVVYVPPESDSSSDIASPENKLSFRSAVKRRQAKPTSVKPKEPPRPNSEGELADRNARAGTPYGSLWAMLKEGHDVKPAYPIVYPAPDFSETSLPSGFRGLVIVEVSIDRDGFVFETKVVKSLGPSIDEKALAAVQKWRFHPALLDGQPIASKHDVYFHLPS